MKDLDFKNAAEFYQKMGFKERNIGFGQRPAIILVDFQYLLTRGELSGGNIFQAAQNCKPLIELARERKIPLIYTYVAYREDFKDSGYFGKKAPELSKCILGSKNVEIDEVVNPEKDDLIICKKMPSAFFGTPLQLYLTTLSIDTLIITGNSTSGCVRATVVDACSYGYRVIIPEECVGDRHEAPHHANLFDMRYKYADVLPLQEVLSYLRKVCSFA